MKNKLFILFILVSSLVYGQSVPNTETFTLQNVYTVVDAHANPSANLSDCFAKAVSSYFDPTYNNDSYAPANSLKRFRNYTIKSLLSDVKFCWEFEVISGNTVDDSNNQFDGTISDPDNNISEFVTGKMGYGINVGGQNGGVVINNSAIESATYSVAMWINGMYVDGTALERLFSFCYEEAVAINWAGIPYSSTTLRFWLINETYVNNPINTEVVEVGNVWTHVVVTRTPNSQKLYINGSLSYTLNASLTNNYSSVPEFTTGGIYGLREFQGKYDQVALWHRDLTASEISTLYNSGNGLTFTNW